jgi:plasmid stability protein
MATITIRGVPPELVQRIKDDARRKGRSMEQELRELLAVRYPSRAEAVAEVRARWKRLPPTSAEEADGWVEKGRS